jgi:hypothetical protein
MTEKSSPPRGLTGDKRAPARLQMGIRLGHSGIARTLAGADAYGACHASYAN